MLIELNGLNINYEVAGEGNEVILLHGWGVDIDSLRPVFNHLCKNFKTYAMDLPGFGKSEEPIVPWSASDYAGIVEQFINKLNIKNPILFGHSNGGRTIIYLTGKLKVNARKIVLIDSAGIKPKRTLKYYFKVYTYKTIKNCLKIPFLKRYASEIIEASKKKLGSSDYNNASVVMRQTMVKLINEDLKHLLPSISSPTLLIWGENDTATPLSDGKLMEKLIPNAGLVVFKNAGHYSYLDKFNDFLIIIDNFLKEDIKK